MGIASNFLEIMRGRVHFFITVGNVPAVEIKIEGKEIIAEIKNPLLAVELGIEEFIKSGPKNKNLFKEIKKMGYKIKIKYKFLEVEI